MHRAPYSDLMKQAERACLVIVDISGYTTYLAGVELDHAQDVLADLLNAVVTPLRPGFQLAKLEGDAVFLYSPIEEIDGSVLLDRIDSCYFAFRHRLLSITQATTCECNACLRIPELDLKLVVHHGSIIRHEVLGREELVGTDVIVVHRLLKNEIGSRLGIPAYAFLTDACLEATELDAARLGLARHDESYDDVGSVAGWVHDLQRAWELESERNPVYVGPEDALGTVEGFVADVPVARIWEWLTTPALRLRWETGFDDIVESLPAGGRRGPGAHSHCVHGDDVIMNEVVDWRPPHYVTNLGRFPDGTPYIVTDELIEVKGGVIVRKNVKPSSEETRPQLEQALAALGPVMEKWIPTLASLVTKEHLSRQPVNEPDLPVPDEAGRLSTAVRP